MKQVLFMVGASALCAMVVGCGSDPREGLVNGTVEKLQNAATKVATINKKIEDAVKKTEPGKTVDFKEAILEVDSLKTLGKEMQRLKIETDALKDKTPEDEQKALAERIRVPLNNAIERLSKARKDLNETMASVESTHKGELKVVREKLDEANGEFEAIARQR